jgi:hypothetical protein
VPSEHLAALLRCAAQFPDAERFARAVSAAQRGKVTLDEQVHRGIHRHGNAMEIIGKCHRYHLFMMIHGQVFDDFIEIIFLPYMNII